MDIEPAEDGPDGTGCNLPPMNEFLTISARYLAIMAASLLIFLWILVDRLWYRLWTSRHSYRERVLYGARRRHGRKKTE